ncbi:DNA repair protein RadC [Thiohalocapsa halophila]|uniref:DNA repair protein RadC n=1 Tax=Thiohalocapsa halophila TaxID=69359 RepID=A0ABS1CFI4_9GAMM|nr:DNA repair protein RadC [Thiohalocapsa halophila]MBK1630649.1 DNA repair protein RadC [Thiohalocapsa halophila]
MTNKSKSKPQQFALALEPDETRRPELDTDERALIQRAIACLEAHYHVRKEALTSPDETRDYLKLRLAGVPYEVFAILLLDNRHRVLQYRELFRGTIDGASVHPREVVREAMRWNAAAVILAHNHPSGVAEPSQADLRITQQLKDALSLIEVRVLDHIVIGEGAGTSLAERGLL